MAINTLFVASNQRGSGSIIVTMGLMQLLKSKIKNVGFFRPIIQDKPENDHDITFMLRYFGLDQQFDESYALNKNQFESLVAEGNFNEAMEIIIEKYKGLQSKNDFIVIEGLAKSEFLESLAFDINFELAKNLDADYITIINAKEKNIHALQNEIHIVEDGLKEYGLRKFMTIINRIDVSKKSEIESLLQEDIYCLTESSELALASIGEIQQCLDAKMIFGNEDDYQRVVSSNIVAAMQPQNYITKLHEKGLILTPADRVDILTTTILALHSKHYPNISGIVLTGGLELDASIYKLLEGLEMISFPILATQYDTYQSAKKVSKIIPKITPTATLKIASALGLFFENIDSGKVLEKLEHHTEHIMTPSMFEYNIFTMAHAKKKTIVLPESMDERILRATEIILRRSVANIILLGDEEKITTKAGILGLDISQARIINPLKSDLLEPFAGQFYALRKHKGISPLDAKEAMTNFNYFGTMLVHTGIADGMVSGAMHTTADTIRPALQIIKTKPNISIVSSVFFMCLDTKVLVYGDCAVNQNPNPIELAQIALSSATTAYAFGITPKVAMLSYSTGSSGSGEDVQKIQKATILAKELAPNIPIEGPLQYDAATDITVALAKLPNSAVAGHANVLIFPDLNTSNNTYKAVQRSSGAIAIGPILQGLNKPINDLSRGCLVADIVNTIAITAIQAGADK